MDQPPFSVSGHVRFRFHEKFIAVPGRHFQNKDMLRPEGMPFLPADTLRRPETIAKARFLAYSQP